MWLLKKLKKIVKIATAAETLVQGHSAESRFSLANLLNKILYPDPSKERLAKIECRTDNHQI